MKLNRIAIVFLVASLTSCAGSEGEDEDVGSISSAFVINKTHFFRNWATQRCLDSNSSGKVYTTANCYYATYQGWVANLVNNNWELRNLQTGRCLDSNAAGKLYTSPCNGGAYQQWQAGIHAYTIMNIATGRYMDSNGSGDAYTLPSNGGQYQKWDVSYNPN